MSVRVKLATAPEEIRALMGVRHHVYVEEYKDLPALTPALTSGAIVDLYDALPTTEHLIAVGPGGILGGVRVTRDSAGGMPGDGYFDFRALLPAGAHLAACSMLCLRSSNRSGARILRGLIRMCVHWAAAKSMTYLCAPMSPRFAPILRQIGFGAVGETFVDRKGLATVPMVLDLSSHSDEYALLVRRPDAKLWLDGFERAIFEEGDLITQRGEAGDEAFIVMEGSADVVAYGAEPGGPIVRTFGPGDLFGELSLLSDRPRSATVVAAEPMDVMVLSRREYERQMVENPALTIGLMRTIGNRFHETIVLLNETEDETKARQEELSIAVASTNPPESPPNGGDAPSAQAANEAAAASTADGHEPEHPLAAHAGTEDTSAEDAPAEDASAEDTATPGQDEADDSEQRSADQALPGTSAEIEPESATAIPADADSPQEEPDPRA